jgi:hypothetical protein
MWLHAGELANNGLYVYIYFTKQKTSTNELEK